jgi:CRISPR-associated protein Csm3
MANIEKLLERKQLTGRIRLLSGLHIGAGKDSIEIGGLDLPVIKNPVTGEPIIPGSSLKGKLRFLLEWYLNKVEDDGKEWGTSDKWKEQDNREQDPVLRLFGTTHKDWKGGPTRLIVRDASLEKEWVQDVTKRGLPLTEEKMEVSINRIQGKARDGGLHKSERVPAGAHFDFEIVIRIFSVDGDNGSKDGRNIDYVLTAMRLLELDALGGSGSRGYGRILFENLLLNGEPIQERFEKIDLAAAAAVA